MTTSGSVDFTVVRDNIITDAIINLGVADIGETPSPEEIEYGTRKLNQLVKSLQNFNVFLWTVEWVTQTVALGSSYFDPTTPTYDDTIAIEKAYYRDNNTDQPIEIIDKFEFADIPDKTTTGKPLKMWVEKKNGPPRMHLWPVTDASTVIYYCRVRKLEDFDADENTADFPVSWTAFLTARLSEWLAPAYSIPINERLLLKQTADDLFKQCRKDNTETTDDDFIGSAY